MSEIRPLEGTRVVDFSWVWSGPQVGAWLAEFGAEVIKIEHGKRLDNTRLRGRPLINGVRPEGPSIELHPYFHQVNHGKRSITLDLKLEAARDLACDLIGISDIVIENLSPGALQRLGFGYDAVAAINPRIVYLSMSALGQTGPQANMRAYAPIMSAYAGMEAQVGYTGEAPIGMMNYGIGDPNAAAHALLPLLAALYDRERSGRGVHIDMAQIEALICALPEPVLTTFADGAPPARAGSRHPHMVPHGVFPTAEDDRWISVAVADDEEWAALTVLLNLSEPGFATLQGRQAAIDVVESRLAAWTGQKRQADSVAALRAIGISASPLLTVAEQWEQGQVIERGILREVEHPVLGRERLYSAPWVMSETPPIINASAPCLGADNDYVFGELLHLDMDRIERLKADGVIA